MGSKLWTALALVREGELCKRTRDNGSGAHCALGFLDEAYGFNCITRSTPETAKDVRLLAETLLELFPDRHNGYFGNVNRDGWIVADINNHGDTTQADIELAFEKAAIRCDELVIV